VHIPQENHVKYLGLHLDRRLTWHTHIFSKRKQHGLSLTKMYWLLGRKSKLSTNNRLLIYKAIFKPIRTYGNQLWDTTPISNIEILERFQSKVLRLIVDAPWYVSNSFIRKDLQIPTVEEEISRFSSLYAVRLRAHTNELTAANPQASAPILAKCPAYQILAYFHHLLNVLLQIANKLGLLKIICEPIV
jgi:hypothetical protein